MTNYPQSRKSNIVVQDLDNEVLIYDLKINKAFCLNETSALVYQLCDGNRTVAKISELMSVKLKTLVSEDIVWLALDGLKKDDLLENEAELPNHFAGLSRREVVKKVGLASMVMLPIISSIIAPTAVNAQSGCVANGGTVTYIALPGESVEFCSFSALNMQCCSNNFVGFGTYLCKFVIDHYEGSATCSAAPER